MQSSEDNHHLTVVKVNRYGFIAADARGNYAAFRGFDDMLSPWAPDLEQAERCIDPEFG